MARTWVRWLPAAVAPAVVAGALAATSQAGAAVDLPDRSAEEVLVLAAEHEVTTFSGDFEQTSELGLPQLPGGFSHGTGPTGDRIDGEDESPVSGEAPDERVTELLDLVTGSRTGRVFVADDAARLQLMDPFAERNLVRNGDEVWTYDSAENTATVVTLPADRADAHGLEPAEHPTPDEVADRVLDAVGPTTDVTVGTDALVAGRAAYELVLTPRTTSTLVGSVSLAVDGETGFPLAVTVHARGQVDPAFDLRYTSLDLDAPDPALFEFTPPPGATVIEKDLTDGHGDLGGHGVAPERLTPDRPPSPGDLPEGLAPTVDGEAWETVLVLPAGPTDAADGLGVLTELTTAVDGGRLLSTALVNVLLADDGRVLVGSVPLERLQAVAAR